MRIGSIDMHGRLYYQTDYVRAIYGDAGEIALCFFNNAIVPLRLENNWLKVLDKPLMEFQGVIDILYDKPLHASVIEFELRVWTSVVKVTSEVGGSLTVEYDGDYLYFDAQTIAWYMSLHNIERRVGFTFSSGIGYGSTGYRFRKGQDCHVVVFPNGMSLPLGLDGSLGSLIKPKAGKVSMISVQAHEIGVDFVRFDLVLGVYHKVLRFDNITYTNKFIEFDVNSIKSSEVGKLLLLRG